MVLTILKLEEHRPEAGPLGPTCHCFQTSYDRSLLTTILLLIPEALRTEGLDGVGKSFLVKKNMFFLLF